MSSCVRRLVERAMKQTGDMSHFLALAKENGGRITYDEIEEIIFRRRIGSELIRAGMHYARANGPLMARIISGNQLTETDRDKLIFFGLAKIRKGAITNMIKCHGASKDKQLRVVDVPSTAEKINNKDSKNAT